MEKAKLACPNLGQFLELIRVMYKKNGKPLSVNQICRQAHIKSQTCQKVLRGEASKVYAYYAVLRIYLPDILREYEEGRPEAFNALINSMEADFEYRLNP